MNALERLLGLPRQLVSSVRDGGRPRTVPANVLADAELIHLGGGEMVPCPGIETLPLAPVARELGLGSPSLALPPAKVHLLRNATLCPGSRLVRAADGRIVAESLTADMVGRVPLGEAEHPGRPVEMAGTVALFRSPWHPQFHTLIDHLPRAALLSQPAMNRVGPIILVHDGPLSPMEELLLPRLVGHQIELRRVAPDRAIRADRVLLPGYVTRPAAGAIPSWYRRWIDRTAAQIGPATCPSPSLPRRFFVDRTHGHRQVVNRDELDRVLRAHGVIPLDLSTLTSEDVVRCFRDAELVVGVTGSGLANAVFSRSARVVELTAGRELLPHFFYLCASKGLPYELVPARSDAQTADAVRRLQSDVVVDTDALDRLLARV